VALEVIGNDLDTTEFRIAANEVLPRITQALRDSQGAIGEMEAIFADVDDTLNTTSASFEDQIDMVNGYRSTVVLIGWITLIGLMVFELFAMATKKFAPVCSKNFKCCWSTITCLYIVIIFFLTIVVVVIAVVVFMLSDFCAEPNENFKMFLNLENTTFGYYVDCDHRTAHADGSKFVNPFNPQTREIFAQSQEAEQEIRDLADDELEDLNVLVQANPAYSNAYKANADVELDLMQTKLYQLSASLGGVVDTVGYVR
jgi:hypothetical protein